MSTWDIANVAEAVVDIILLFGIPIFVLTAVCRYSMRLLTVNNIY